MHARTKLIAIAATLSLVTAACGATDDSDAVGAGPDDAASTATEAAADDEPTTSDDTDTSEDATEDATADEATEFDRTIEVEMSEFAYSPADLTVQAGETVRFVFTNSGAAPHEAILGSMHVQEEHEAEMAEGGMDADHDEGMDDDAHEGEIPSISLEAGESGEIIHTFTVAEELMLGCHIPGHWDAGMQAAVNVTA